MASCGLDRVTGLPIYDLDHVAQCLEVIFSTRQGEMIALEWFGCGMPELLGRRITPELIARYRMMLAVGIDTWEPRLKVLRTNGSGNTINAVTLGRVRHAVIVLYRPRGHLGDSAVEGGERTLLIGASGQYPTVALAA
jgi:uncharacterized protein